MPKLTEEKIAELRALCEKATPGPWGTRGLSDHIRVESSAPTKNVAKCGSSKPSPREPDMEEVHANAEFIVAARTALPDLLSDLEEARRERDEAHKRAIELETQLGDAAPHDGSCDRCGKVPAIVMDTVLCDECMDGVKRAKSAERALAEARQEWVRVKLDKNFQAISDNLPEVEQEVLIAHFASTPHWHAIATFNKKRRFHDDNDGDDYGGVDHWRPLPAPPETTTKE